MNIDVNYCNLTLVNWKPFWSTARLNFRLGLTKSRLKEATLPLTNNALPGFQNLTMDI